MSSLRADEKHIQQTSLSTFHMISDVCGRPELIPAMISALGHNKSKRCLQHPLGSKIPRFPGAL